MPHPQTSHCVLALCQWYKKHARDLPWRNKSDPYAIWVSEVMLQQTQVATVLRYYDRFLQRFPTLRQLADAPIDDVLALWSGLGYYRRARSLHEGAKYMLKHHGGEIPNERDIILAVPSIGPYTAGAVLSFAYGKREPIVDANIIRVFMRFYANQKNLMSPRIKKWLWQKATEWVSVCQNPGELNQALMELGSLVCLTSNPLCESCPLSVHCALFRKGYQDKIPASTPKTYKPIWWVSLVVTVSNKVFVTKNGAGGWWHGLWDFPRIEFSTKNEAQSHARVILESLDAKVTKLGDITHSVTNHRITVLPLHVKLGNKKLWCRLPGFDYDEGRWVRTNDIMKLAHSSLFSKIWKTVSFCRETRQKLVNNANLGLGDQ